jgi:hypothetical protein
MLSVWMRLVLRAIKIVVVIRDIAAVVVIVGAERILLRDRRRLL